MTTIKIKIKRFELKKNKTKFEKNKITTPEQAASYIRNFYGDDLGIYESFFILLLDYSSNTIGYAKISQGGTVGTIVDFAIIAKYAIESLAKQVIIAHNHPSGNLKPSDSDKRITNKIKEGLQLFDIILAEHIILTEDNYFSFADNGLI